MGNVLGFLGMLVLVFGFQFYQTGRLPVVGATLASVTDALFAGDDGLPGGVRQERGLLRATAPGPVMVAYPYMGPVKPVGVMNDGLNPQI